MKTLREHPPKNKFAVSQVTKLRRATLSYKPKSRFNANRKLWAADRSIVEGFYKSTDVSVLMPNKRRTGDALPFYVMQCSLVSAFRSFRVKYPEINIGIFTFQKARPRCVHLLKKMKWLQCVCDICANLKYIIQSIRVSHQMNGYDLPGWLQQSAIETGLETICFGQEKYSAKCLKRTCDQCGSKHLLSDLENWLNDNVADVVKWKEWAKAEQEVNGKVVSRMKLGLRTGTRQQIAQQLREKLSPFGKHAFYAKWQQMQYASCLEQLQVDEVITVVDFSENFTVVQQEEAQSAYYSHNQVTIHPCVCNYKDESGTRIRDSVVFISDELKHDAAAVGTFINQLLEHKKLQMPMMKRLIVWSDGCSAQYKSKQPFANLAARFGHDGVIVEWHFFGSRHGKNPSDGETGVIKTKMSRLMIANQVFVDTAEDFAKAAARHLTVLDGTSLRHIYFVPSARILATRESQLPPKPIKGSRDLHALSVVEYGRLSTNSASCFCRSCRGSSGRCPSGIKPSTSVEIFEGMICSKCFWLPLNLVHTSREVYWVDVNQVVDLLLSWHVAE